MPPPFIEEDINGKKLILWNNTKTSKSDSTAAIGHTHTHTHIYCTHSIRNIERWIICVQLQRNEILAQFVWLSRCQFPLRECWLIRFWLGRECCPTFITAFPLSCVYHVYRKKLRAGNQSSLKIDNERFPILKLRDFCITS